MCEIEKRTISELIIFFGFSRQNAKIAIEMLHNGMLEQTEEEVIKYIQHTGLEKGYPGTWFVGDKSNARLLEHLNYRITQLGGHAATPDRKKRIC